VDLLVDLPPHMGLLRLGRLEAELEAILDAKVDLIPASDLKPVTSETKTGLRSSQARPNASGDPPADRQ
jgi:predicted nucleotidyltransferase